MEPSYTAKEVLDIQLRSLNEGMLRLDKTVNHELSEVKGLIKEQNVQIEKRAHMNDLRFGQLDLEIKSLKGDIQELKEESARYKVIWGIGATVGASLVAFVLNKVF